MINFSQDRWARVREHYTDWWAGNAKTPVLGAVIVKDGVDYNKVKLISQANVCDMRDPEQVVDDIIAHLGSFEFYGDAFPLYNFDCFGPGILAGFLGATVSNATGNVWFHPKETLTPDKLRFSLDKTNEWFTYLESIYRIAT